MLGNKKGFIHSFQSLGAVDGPGIRYVVFMQGCPYRCPYCHNPDTHQFSVGDTFTTDEIVEKVVRYKTYFKSSGGGVTVSGGEPLYQAEFVAELFEKLHKNGITTVLDTAGKKIDKKVLSVLKNTDMVMCDLKFAYPEQYKEHVGIELGAVLEFLAVCDSLCIPVVIRHVVVPGITDTKEYVLKIKEIAESVVRPHKIELLPFKKLCLDKYKKLGIKFPLEDTPECEKSKIDELYEYLK